jgi:hypothetical protein
MGDDRGALFPAYWEGAGMRLSFKTEHPEYGG